MTRGPLDPEMERVVRLQSDVVREGEFFLAGGTGLRLWLGHRHSEDLDWFSPRRFDVRALQTRLSQLAEAPTAMRQDGRHTLRAYYGELETSFITYDQVVAHPRPVSVGGTKIPLADVEALAAMKAAAVHDRGAKRDFIDIQTICTLPGWSVARFIDHAASKLPLCREQVARALTYFVDADKQPMPRGFAPAWNDVKARLIAGVRQWERAMAKDKGRGGLDR